MSMVFPGITHCEYCGERIDIDTGRRCNCLDGKRIIQKNKPKLKLIDVLNKIANGELKEGTKVIRKDIEGWGDIEYTYKNGDLERKCCDETIYVYEEMFSRHLNEEVELIEPEEPTDNTKIEELWGYMAFRSDYERDKVIIDKLNEVIR